tara:strand:+ start:9628 stop:10362 length:735 start_codon:yes stop_codon:yes gene_type:complete
MSDSNDNAPVLRAKGIRRSFAIGDRTLEVLHGIDLDLYRGEKLCLMGASGAGKTTFLNVLGLLDRPNEGSVEVEGRACWDLSAVERAAVRNSRLGFVFQFYHLLAELDAVENTLLPAMIAGRERGLRANGKALRAKAIQMLTDFGLADRLTHRPGRMSGGEQQRVAIARALIMDPPVLIADEPTGNLDSTTGEKVLELLFAEQERRGLALLLVTHDERLASRCDRVVTMEDGQIQADSASPIPL